LCDGRCQGSGYAKDPPFGKTFEIDRENPGFLRKRPPFQNPGDASVLLAGHNITAAANWVREVVSSKAKPQQRIWNVHVVNYISL
jgi:hypothetical protein